MIGLITGSRIENGSELGVDIDVDVPTFVAHDIQIANNTFRAVHASAIAGGDLGADPTVFGITIEGNTLPTRANACAGGIYLWAPGPNSKLCCSHFTIRDNHLKLIRPMLQAERITDLAIERNATGFKSAGGGEKRAVEVLDSRNAMVVSNDFTGYADPVSADAPSTGISR